MSEQAQEGTSSANKSRGKKPYYGKKNPGARPQQQKKVYVVKNAQASDQAAPESPAPSQPVIEQQKKADISQIIQKDIQQQKKEEKPETKSENSNNNKKSNIKKRRNQQKGNTEFTINLGNQLKKGTYECMVCYDKIGVRANIWSCAKCYAIFHIGCISKWSNKCKEENQPTACPGCRAEHSEKLKPSCFCGKAEKPKFDGFLTPHSCGEICRKKRTGTNCPHTCALVCHPGPCPPCPALAPVNRCFCGKTSYRLRCGERDDGKSCDNACGRLLSCKKHFCQEKCHPGDCNDCSVAQTQSCYCGQSLRDSFCGKGEQIVKKTLKGAHTGYFSCEKICNLPLSCGNHFCKQPCHQGPCNQCSTDVHIQSCPCGNKKLAELLEKPRESCLDPIPTCNNTCGKLLHCKQHFCQEICHTGQCKDCTKETVTACRCGLKQVTMKCLELRPSESSGITAKEPLCTTLCDVKRACGKHRCNTVCCPMKQIGPDAHPCPFTCDKLLSCKLHKCKANCHKGPCLRCPNVSFDELVCRCGKTVIYPPILCGVRPPKCNEVCNRPHSCGHPVLHDCHYDEVCPKCFVLVSKQCACGKEMLPSVQCHIEYPSCGQRCNKLLKCGNHGCPKYCHPGPCELDSIQPGESCRNPCNAILPTCPHHCMAPCHPNESCPEVVCQMQVTLTCPCGVRTENGICSRGGECPQDISTIRLECDEKCALKARQRQLAIAFGRIEDCSDLASYSMFLTSACNASPLFVEKIESIFRDFIKAEQRVFRFPVMNSYYRQIIHEVAKFYKLESIYDKEPYCNVVISKTQFSTVPHESLHTILSRHPIPKQPGTGEGISHTKPGIMLLYDLTNSIRSEHIHSLLKFYKNEYFLKWIDEESAVVIFNDISTMKVAAYAISANRVYKVKAVSDADVEEIFSAKVKQNKKKQTTQVEQQDDAIWDSCQPAEEVGVACIEPLGQEIYKGDETQNEEPPEDWSELA